MPRTRPTPSDTPAPALGCADCERFAAAYAASGDRLRAAGATATRAGEFAQALLRTHTDLVLHVIDAHPDTIPAPRPDCRTCRAGAGESGAGEPARAFARLRDRHHRAGHLVTPPLATLL
ncbi:hypothetical protein ACN20G_27150 (plasmid) [Streptomyces sp. BI20]|uniref:hypothetical protein n=1 Tax=Streptomyces sp. BI20 TaxID=3403460 RepID=UPI003C722E56